VKYFFVYGFLDKQDDYLKKMTENKKGNKPYSYLDSDPFIDYIRMNFHLTYGQTQGNNEIHRKKYLGSYIIFADIGRVNKWIFLAID
jgi:hypothetical protein